MPPLSRREERQIQCPNLFWSKTVTIKIPQNLKPVSMSTLLGFVFFATLLYFFPKYRVWQQGLAGEAELKRAEQNRRISVMEAEAKRDAATALAAAEIERARGVAEANKIIGEGLKGHEEYLRYLWIMSLEHAAAGGNHTVVYIPTEANLPILEAGRK